LRRHFVHGPHKGSRWRSAHSLTVGGMVKFRMCRVAARGYDLEPDDIHGFVEVMPMADAEIIRLQQEESYAYMR
jgi:intracellular sulfur oxidation DsrE/DsrF family protein